MSYPKGKDMKIKNIEQLDNIENRGIEIRFKTNEIKEINVIDNMIITFKRNTMPPDFMNW